MRVSKFTRRNGCGRPVTSDTGATTDRPSYASEPESQRSAAGVDGCAAVNATPPIVIVAAADGSAGENVADAIAAGSSGKLPAAGTKTLTIAKRIDPSGHRFLTSVCVLNVPTRRPDGATPCGSACPNVAHPGVR